MDGSRVMQEQLPRSSYQERKEVIVFLAYFASLRENNKYVIYLGH